MPADHAINVSLRLVSSRYWGDVTDEDLLEHHRQLTSDPLFNPDFFQIADCRGVKSVTGLHGHSIREVASRPTFSDRSRRVMITDQVVLVGIARMMAIYRDCYGGKEAIHVVKTMEEAVEWLWNPPAVV